MFTVLHCAKLAARSPNTGACLYERMPFSRGQLIGVLLPTTVQQRVCTAPGVAYFFRVLQRRL